MSDQPLTSAPDAPEKLAAPGVTPKDNTRPELHFQNRRKLLTLFFIVLILGVCWFMGSRFANPLQGADMALTGGATAAKKRETAQALEQQQGPLPPAVKGLALTATPPAIGGGIMGASQPNVPAPQQQQPATSGRSSGVIVAAPNEINAVMCRVVSNFEAESVKLLQGSLVRASGFSYAKNGVVYLSDPNVGWVDSTWLGCPPEIVRIERPYFVSPTVTPTGKAKGPEVLRVAVPQTVVVSATPCVLPKTPAEVNGVVLEGDCVIFQITGVRAIYADGKPVSGGTKICGVNNFSVTIR
ncbi:MAG: hypothetical protein FJ009_06105 [Chloroflexi bacterium]|nr:hypothetical protein [Chloroflexota bacterium]